MNRREFLKKLGVVCGVAAVCPTKLLKARPEKRIITANGCDPKQKWGIPPGFFKDAEFVDFGINYWVKIHTHRNPDGKHILICKKIPNQEFYK